MRRARSPGSDGSDTDADRQAEYEQEYMNLQRQYRLLEKDKNTYMQESQEWIRRQRAEIDQLEKEHSDLATNSRLIQSDANIKRNKKQCQELQYLGELKNNCEKELQEERKKQLELDKEIRNLEAEERGRNGSAGGKNNTNGNVKGRGTKGEKVSKEKSGISSSSNETRKLENQLQLSNNSFGKLLEANRALRREIDNLRVERQKFDDLYQKLLKEKESLKRKTNKVIDESTKAYEQRVEAQDKMAALREKNERDVQQHNAEMKELRRIIDHDNKLQAFMGTKGAERGEDEQLGKWRADKERYAEERKKASQTDTVESYEAALQEIREMTGQDDINLIVRHFRESEEENFALLNLVNEQNNKIEQLQEDIDKLYKDIDALVISGSELEISREHILKQLEEHQVNCSRDTEKYNENCKELKKVLDEVKAGVSQLFTKISCDRSTIDESLGSEDGVTDGNVIEHLGIIEERTNQLLLMLAFATKQKMIHANSTIQDIEEFVRKQTTLLGDGPLPQNQLQVQTIAVPSPRSVDLDPAELDEDRVPFSRARLEQITKLKIEEKLQKQEQHDRRHLVNVENTSADRTSKSLGREQQRAKSVRVK